MEDFDITNMRGRNSFADSLRKRKALGLYDSDSDDDKPKQKKTVKKPVGNNKPTEVKEVLKPKETNTVESKVEKPIEIDPSIKLMQESIRTTNRYIEEAEALLSIPVTAIRTEKSEKNQKSPIPFDAENITTAIELSDEEGEQPKVAENDIDDLDPELEAILNQKTRIPSHAPLKVTIKLHYVHNFKDLKENTRAIVDQLVKPIKIRILDSDQFHTALNAFCKKKNLKKSDVVLTYKDNLVFLSGTPAGMGMTEVGTHNMEVYPTKCYLEMEEEKRIQRIEMRKKYAEDPQEEQNAENELPQSSIQEEEEDNRMLLKLRNKNNSEISLKVKPTTTLASLVTSYKKHANITSNVELSFEGETLDLNLQVGETDLEDEDLIEVLVKD